MVRGGVGSPLRHSIDGLIRWPAALYLLGRTTPDFHRDRTVQMLEDLGILTRYMGLLTQYMGLLTQYMDLLTKYMGILTQYMGILTR